MMYMHSNNEKDKRINVSKIANTSTMGDNSRSTSPWFSDDDDLVAAGDGRQSCFNLTYIIIIRDILVWPKQQKLLQEPLFWSGDND